ncbi:MAG: hypothetical protein WCH34_05395 [Bacteroidota bacterium]
MQQHRLIPKAPLESEDKGNKFATQLKIVREFLCTNDASRFMVAVNTGIPIQNVCRHVENLFKSNSIQVIRYDKCLISGQWVEFLTTDRTKFSITNQLSLFCDETK